MHGKGIYKYPNGDQYDGDFVEDVKQGNGKLKYGGNLYEGQWKEGKPHGHGKLTNAKNAVDEGNWRQGEFVDEEDVD